MKLEVGKTYEVLEERHGYEVGEKFKVLSITERKVGKLAPETLVGVLVLPEQQCREELEHLLEMKLREVDTSKPAHYDTAIDTIDFMKANFSREAVEGFMRGNAIKYLQRAGKKGDKLDDLRKSAHYLQMLIEWEEGQ